MDYTLRRIRFTEEMLNLPAVQEFDCGDGPWALEVTADLKALDDPNGVAGMVKSGADAWLYATEDGDLVGFSTLCERRWRWPDTKRSPQQPLSVIPVVAVHRNFQGRPGIPGVSNYSDQILDHLRFEAQRHAERLPVLGLCVHPENNIAIKWYLRAGFYRLDGDWKHPVTKVAYWRMALDLKPQSEQSENIVRQDALIEELLPAPEMRSFEEAVSTVLNAPPVQEHGAKKATAKERRQAKKRRRQKPEKR